ncbi:MAG: hypothetical protein RL559_19 [Pseudomonadota bacterium]|jgi:hypothetical protein
MSSNPSGGLRWHWRAWRWRPRWSATCQHIEDWLMAQTEMPSDTLVLIGASAGWMMPPRWLARFACIHTWDIDPWAAPLFRRRHGAALRAQGIALHTHTADALGQLPALVAQHPHALFWFDNLLGQLCLFEPGRPAVVEQRLRGLRQTLAPVAWGSLHDRLSGPVDERSLVIPPTRTVPAGNAVEAPEQQAWLHSINAQSPWGDHLTTEVFPAGTPLAQIAWPFKPGHWHWLEMGWLPAQARAARNRPKA